MSRLEHHLQRRWPRRRAAVLLIAFGAGCTPLGPVPEDEVEQQIESALESVYGVLPTVTCEDPLPAEHGAQIECVLRAPEAPETFFPVDVTVTEVDTSSGEVSFDIEVRDGPEDELSPEDLSFEPR